jgi:hypothetical protein
MRFFAAPPAADQGLLPELLIHRHWHDYATIMGWLKANPAEWSFLTEHVQERSRRRAVGGDREASAQMRRLHVGDYDLAMSCGE